MPYHLSPLKPGDTIGFISPAGPVRYDQFEPAVQRLQSLGYKVRLGQHALSNHGIVSAPPRDRIADIMDFLHDDKVRAIWAIRGGYGTVQLFDNFDFTVLSALPKLMVGFSDLTAWQWAAFAKAGQVSVSGLAATLQLGENNPYVPYGLDLLAGRIHHLDQSHLLESPNVVRHGEARGWLVGGTLSMICSICGTPYWPRKRSLILYLEDVHEPLYRLDRCLQQLRLNGFLDKVRAVILGKFVQGKEHLDVLPLLQPMLPDNIPIVTNLPYGHVTESIPMPMGVRAALKTDPFELSWAPFVR